MTKRYVIVARAARVYFRDSLNLGLLYPLIRSLFRDYLSYSAILLYIASPAEHIQHLASLATHEVYSGCSRTPVSVLAPPLS
jgi:hypothetical protein